MNERVRKASTTDDRHRNNVLETHC